MRQSIQGHGFQFWRWRELTRDNKVFLRRLYIIASERFGGIYLHWHLAPDPGDDLHDHPRWFFSIILRGWYSELRAYDSDPKETRLRSIRWWNYIPLSALHRICSVAPRTISLVFVGPYRRSWGFWTPQGWKHWKEYTDAL